ncbi:phosphatidylserine decarboxylase proenzyme-like, partial [Planoprotostelium fungivorum]
HYDRHYDDVNAKKGDCLGFFHMGSTIVLIFESPEFDFMVQTGQKIQMGQPIGQLRDQARELNLKDVKGRGLPYAGWWFPRAWRLRLSYMKARGLFLIFLIASVVAAGDVLGSINVLNGVVAKRNAPHFDLEGGFMSETVMSNGMGREILRRYTEQLLQRVLRQRLSQRRSLSGILEMKMKEIMKQRRR